MTLYYNIVLNVLYVGLYIVYSVHFLCIRFFFKIFVIALLSQITECVFIFRFTLADGKTKLTVPRTKILSVKFKDGCDIFSVTSVSNTIDIEFIGLTTENYKALVAELRSEDGTTDIEIVPRAENKDVEIKEPVFTDGKCTGTTVKINKKGISGEKAVLKVTLIDNNGQEISVSRIVKFFGAGALDEAAQNGGSFILSDDIILEKPVEVAKGKELVLDLNGKTISNF
jgi:hypothetical protein